MVETREQRHALDALLGRSLVTRARFGVVLSWMVIALLAVAMLVVRLPDGVRGFFEGVVARGVSLHLLLVSLPFAFSLAGGAASLDPGHAALAKLRDLGDADIARAGPRTALRMAALRCALPSFGLAALATVLSLDDPHVAVKRLLTSVLLVLLGVFSAAALAALGVLATRLAGRRGRWVLLAVVLVPWMVAAVPSIPSEVSLPGAYRALVAEILSFGP